MIIDMLNNLCDIKSTPIEYMRVESFTRQLLTEVNQIIEFDNFPEDNNQTLLKSICFREGMAGLLKDGDEYYVASVTRIGLPRKDGRPNMVTARYMKKTDEDNYAVTIKSNLINDKDIVLFYNGGLAAPDIMIPRFAYILSEIDKSIKANVKYSRMNPLVKVRDNIEKAQLDKAIEDSDIDKENRKYTYISSETLRELEESGRDAILNLSDVTASDKIQYLSHAHLDIMNRFNSIFGVPANTTGKMAQQSVEEISGQDAKSWLIPLDMLKEAKEFCERVKKCFGLVIVAHFGIVHEMNFNKFVNRCTLELGAHEDPCDNEEKEEESNDENLGNMETETGDNEQEDVQ